MGVDSTELNELALRYSAEWEILGAMDRLASRCDDFGDLQIKDICAEAHISKPTFYRHFGNREEAVQWHIDQIARISLTRIGYDLPCADGIERMLRYSSEFRNLYHLLGKTEKDNPLISRNFTGQVMRSALMNTLTRKRRLALTSELEFQVFAFYDVLHGAIERWRLGGLKDSPSEFARLCVHAAPRELVEILDGPFEH